MPDEYDMIADIMAGFIAALEMRGTTGKQRNLPYSRRMLNALETVGDRCAETP